MTELQIQRCNACGTNLFPARLRCPNCGGSEMTRASAGPGHIEEETSLRRTTEPVRLGSVRLTAGPVVIARLDNTLSTGAEVRLDEAPNGAIHARKTERSD